MEQISRQSRATLSLSPRLSYENVDHDYDNKLLIKYQNCSSFNNLIKFKKNDDNHLTDEKTNNKFKNIYNAKQISRFTLILTIFLFMIPITIISTATTSTTITSIPNSHQKHMRLFTSTGQQQRDLNQYKTVYACEGNKLELSCANEGKLIHLVRATYGRFSLSMCNEHGHSNFSVQCVQFRAFLIMQPICNGFANCSVIASKDYFGDPCEGTSKYLEVQYYCDEPHSNHNNGSNHSVQAASAATGARQATNPAKTITTTSIATQQATTNSNDSKQTATSNTNPTQQHITSTSRVQMQQQQQQQQQQTCAGQVSVRSLTWNVTRAGQFARQACPEGSSGQALWLCDARKLTFSPASGPDFSQCRTLWLAKMSSQLEQLQASVSPSQNSLSMANKFESSSVSSHLKPLDTYKSFLQDLRTLVESRQLFSEDLKIVNVMLSQIVSSLVKHNRLIATLGASSRSLNMEESYERLLESLSYQLSVLMGSLLDKSQRLAWLELSSTSQIRSIQAQLLNTYRQHANSLALALIATGRFPAPASRYTDSSIKLQFASFNVTSPQSIAVIQQQTNSIASNNLDPQQQQADSYVSYTNNIDYLYMNPQPVALHSPLLSHQTDSSDSVSKAHFKGVAYFVIISGTIPDYTLLKQQMQLAFAPATNAILQQAILDPLQSRNHFLNTIEPELHIEGVFPVQFGDSPADNFKQISQPFPSVDSSAIKLSELLAQWPLTLNFKVQQQHQFCSSNLNPIDSINEPDSIGGAGELSAASNNLLQERCQTIRSSPVVAQSLNGADTSIVCRCEQMGFVTISSADQSQSQMGVSSNQDDSMAAALWQINNNQRSQVNQQQNQVWQRAGKQPFGLDQDQSISSSDLANSYVFGQQQTTMNSDTTLPITTSLINNQQQAQSKPSQALFSGMLFGLGLVLLLCTLIALFMGLSRLSLQSRLLASKQATYLGSGSTTDPQLEHSLVAGCCPIVSSATANNTLHHQQHSHSTATTTTTANNIVSPYQFHYHSSVGPNSVQQQQHLHHQSHHLLSSLTHKSDLNNQNNNNNNNNNNTLNSNNANLSAQLTYGMATDGSSSLRVAGGGQKVASRFLPKWLLSNPLNWLNRNHNQSRLPPHLLGNNHNHYDQHISPLHSNIIQHHQIPQQLFQQQHHRGNLINVAHYQSKSVASNKNNHFQQNAFNNTNSHLMQLNNPQLIAALNAGASSNSTSSYVSSSAYYEEIGQPGGNKQQQTLSMQATPTTTNSSLGSASQLIPAHHQRTIVDPFKGPNNIIVTSNLNNSHHSNHNNYL